jgi:hypothetical protein
MSKAWRSGLTAAAGHALALTYLIAAAPYVSGLLDWFSSDAPVSEGFAGSVEWVVRAGIGLAAGIAFGGAFLAAGYGTAIIVARGVLGWKDVGR